MRCFTSQRKVVTKVTENHRVCNTISRPEPRKYCRDGRSKEFRSVSGLGDLRKKL